MAKQTLEQERQEALAVQNGYVKTSPSFSASAGVQSKPTGGFTEVGNAIGAGIDTTAQVVDNAINAIKAIANTPRTMEETNADGTTTYYPFGKADNPYQGLEPLGQALQKVLPTSVVSNTDRLFLYNNDTLRYNEAVRMGKVLDIDPDVIMRGDDKAFERADYLSRRVERGAVLQDIYDEFPELYKVKYGSQAEQLQAINNLQSIRATKSTFDAIQQGIWSMNDQMKLGDVGFELAHTKDPERINELTSEMERLQNNLRNYRTPDGTNPLQEVFGQTAAQAYMMGKQGGTGAIIGGAIGAVIGGLTTDGVGIGAGAVTGAKWGGGADMAYEMYKMSFGNKYLELINKRDANGNKVYSNDEAYKYAMTYAAVDTGIEMASTRFMVKGIGKVAPKAVMSKVLQGATSDTIATFNRGIGTTVAQMAKASVKAGGSELVEEGLQDINEKFQHNLYRNANDPEGVYSIGDMAVGAGGAMLQALPAVIGLGAIGGGISGIHTMKAFHEFQKLTPEEQQHAIMAEQNRNGNAIMQALKQDAASNKMAKENPELYGKIVQAQGDNVGVSTAYVNVNEMAETEQGQQAIKNMIDSGLVTQEEVSKSIEANADIPVPIGKYAQLSGGLTEETVKALEESTYFTRGGMSMKTLERAKAEVEAFNNNLVDATEKKAERVKESIIRDEFEDASDVDREVLDQVFSNPTQVKQAYNNLYKNLVQEYRENYASDFDNMDNDIKEATASGVEPQWLTDYKSNNSGKAPRTNAERRRATYHSSVAKAQIAFADNAEALNQSNIHHTDMEHTLQQIESLERLHDKIFALADNDIALRMQLSKSGYDVYNKVVKAIGESTDRKQRETAKANALLMAQHADVMAQYMRQMGRGGYTAMDYFRDSVRINMSGETKSTNGLNQTTQGDAKLSSDQADWVNTLKNYNPKSNATVKVMDTPLVLQMIGGHNYDVVIKQAKIATILQEHPEITLNEMEQLPFALADPIAIFRSSTVKDSIVVMAELKGNNGLNIVIPMQLNKEKRNNTIVYSLVNSVYTKDTADNKWYQDYLENPKFGTPLYVNEKKATNWYLAEGLSLPQANYHISDFFNKSIPNEKDLYNLKKSYGFKLYQSVNGMTEIMSDGERIINIFKTADRSTFLHEMGHVFFDDIQKLASMDNAPKQLLDDWNTLKEWSGWVDGENVDNTKAHEKFARGWESYLRSGEAPTKGLQRVFRQFSKWLTRIYRSVQRLGGEVPSDIKDIMARMIATQDDIENYAHEQALEQFENSKLYQQLSETEQARVQGYIADIKEKAEERVMRKYMKELDNRPIKEWEEVKDNVQVAIEKRLIEEYPIYKEHQRYLAIGDAALVNTQYGNIENLKKAEIEETGATFEDAIKQEMEHARSEFVEVNNIGKSNEQIAEEMLLSNQGQMALTEEEAKLIKQYTNKDLANNWQLLDKLQRLDPNRENLDAELAPIEKAITKAEQIKQDNAKVAKELNSTSKELDKAEDKIEKLKAQLQERINAVRAIRDGGFGTIPKYMNKARAELGDLTLAQASQYKKYQNQAIRDGKNADRALAVNKVEEALEHKQSQMMNQARARVAFENQQRIKKLRTKLLEQNARITRAKNPVMLDPQLRYFYTHMMYQMGLIKRDGLIPTDGFDETVITNRLDPDAGIAGFNTLISMDDTVSGIFNAKSPRTFATLTVNELNMLEELMTGMYQNGRREYEHNSFLTENGNPLSIDYVERDILDKAIETFGEVEESTFNIENSKTTKNAIFNKMANFVESLQQIKTILRRLDGGKGGPAEMYIYDTINRARQHFNERLESETMRLAKNVALYSRKELYKIRNERVYQVGDARNLTKEQVMALALNWGTERNRQRAMETVKANEVEIERLFQDVLDDRDWEFIIREWEQINSFYPERSAVQERMTGNPLKKEEGITFRIGGRTIEGQYYPIMYDPKTSGKSSNHEMEDIAQSFMSSNATFGYGMSATKSRLDKVKDKQLLLSLDVIPRAITESINHITMREAVTDVNTLINRKEFADYITNKLGASEYQYLRQWVRDQWTTEVSRLTEFDNMMQTIKRNISSAVMAGKVSVAIQNVANIPVAMEQLGTARVMRALYRAGVGVYGRGSGRYNETREFVLGKSVMLRERVQTLDKDMRRGLEIGGKGFTIDGKSIGGYTMEQLGEARDAINSWGYSLLSETDLMLSVPIWKDVYDVEYSKLVQKEGISLERADQRAIELADKAIIDIFGSGDIKDQAGIQRNKGTIANFATTFYTYAGTLWNMQLDGFYAFKDRGDFKKFARVIFYDLFMQAVIMVIYNNLFGSDDDDDPTKVAKSLTKEFVNQSVMGVPFVREGITQAMNRMLGEKVYNRGTSPLSYAVIDKIDDIFTAVNSSKKDWTDVGRAGLQFANSMTGLSNTLTDGVMTIAKYGLTDIDAELEDLLYSVIFDKRLKSKKEKQKEKKQNKY